MMKEDSHHALLNFLRLISTISLSWDQINYHDTAQEILKVLKL